MSSNSNNYKGQLQVYEGNSLGLEHVSTKLAYDSSNNIEYLAECYLGDNDSMARHFIQRFYYDSACNVTAIKTAINKANFDCTDIGVQIMTPTRIRLILNNGDATEAYDGDGIRLDYSTLKKSGVITKKESDNSLIVELSSGTADIVAGASFIINVNDLKCSFEKTKDFTKRRWDHRTRYDYN